MTDTTKRGRGRPRKEDGKKSVQVYVALPPQILEAVDRDAAKIAVARSEFLRRIITDYFNQLKK